MKNSCPSSYSRRYDIAFAALFAVMTAFLIWKAPYGYGSTDESFYLTIPYRLAQGDSLLVDEWHVSQLSGLLLYPIMLLYRALGGTGEGIILTFRYIYVAVQCACALCLYLSFRRSGKDKLLGALCAVAVFMPYAPCFIMALSYNSMGIMALTLSGVTLATARERNWKCLVGGVLYAAAVLSCPYLIAVYVLYTAALIIKIARDKKRGEAQRAKRVLRAWLMFTLGAALLALALLIMLLSRCELDRLQRSIKGIFTDPKHSDLPFSIKVRMYVDMLFIQRGDVMLSLGAIAMLMARQHAEKRGVERRGVYLALAAVFTVAFLIYSDRTKNYVNFLNIALNFAGVCAYILSEKRDKRVFWFVFVPGWLYSFLIHLGSNMEIYCMTSALNVASVASAYFIGCTARELWGEKRGKAGLVAALLLLCVCTQSALTVKERVAKSYSGFETATTARSTDDRYLLYSRVERGVSKGLYMMEDEHFDYIHMLDATESVRNAEGESVVYYAHFPWLYLMDEKENGAFSAWMSVSSSGSAVDRLKEYWDINPEKKPDVIFIDKNAVGSKIAARELNKDNYYTVTKTSAGYILQK